MRSGRVRSVSVLALACAAIFGQVFDPSRAASADPSGAGHSPGPVNVAREAGIHEITRTWSANVGDYDGNGRQDFFLVRHDPQAIWYGGTLPRPSLYRNASGTFVEHTASQFTKNDKHDCAWGDVQPDGLLDLFCAVGLDARSKNELWIQRTDRTFVERATAYGLTANTAGEYRTATFIYADRDMRPDIYVTRYTGNDDVRKPNELWLSRSDGTYGRDRSFGLDKPIGVEFDSNPCLQAVDFNRDGWQDLMVCGAAKLHLYRNDSGRGFTDVTSEKGVSGFWKDAELVRLTGDGLRDLVLLGPKVVRVRKGISGGKFSPMLERSIVGGQGVVTGDFDGNDKRDIYVLSGCPNSAPNSDQADRILLNRGGGVFDSQAIPALPSGGGCGQATEQIDYDDDGKDDFVVLNGRKHKEGPVQLFTYR
jgi:FG-GAP-like repeat